MKPTRILFIVLVLMAVTGLAIVVKECSKPRGTESRAFDAIQDYSQEAKQAHEKEMEAKRNALDRPADQPTVP